MKRKIKFILFLIIFLFILLGYNKIVNAKITSSSGSSTIYVGDTITLTYTPPSGVSIGYTRPSYSESVLEPLSWSGNNNSIATVTAIKQGKAPAEQCTNKATIKGKKAGTIKVTFSWTTLYAVDVPYVKPQSETVTITVKSKNEKYENAKETVKEKEQLQNSNIIGSYFTQDSNYKKNNETGTHKFTGNTKIKMVKNFIESYGISLSNNKQAEIIFKKDASSTPVLNNFYIEFKAKKNITVVRTINSGYLDGKKTYSWETFKLERGKEYAVSFNFKYYENKMWYQAFYDKIKNKESVRNIASNAAIQNQEDVSNSTNELEEAREMLRTIGATVGGEDRENTDFEDVLDDVNAYKPGDIDRSSARKIETKTSKILTIISNIGIAVSVVMLAVIGIKYLLGSIEERAEYKKDMIPYIVGAFMLFGITTIMRIIVGIGDKINQI